MKYLVIASMLISSATVDAAPVHKKVAKASEASACKSLASDYDNASKNLAMLEAQGLTDDSAPRATMRETQSNNILNQARITMDLMKNNGCKSPTAAPSANIYLMDAIKCSTAVMKQSSEAAILIAEGKSVSDFDRPPECDRSKWAADTK